MTNLAAELARAAAMLRQAEGLIIGAGAGMGVDSGLPDFRGDEGFWRAYPPLAAAGLPFRAIANAACFREDPSRAWGFYGHRLALYRAARPHAGFAILRRWLAQMPLGGMVYTSNVDGQFHKAGFDPEAVVECHGSIHRLQCLDGCPQLWSAEDLALRIDEESLRAAPPLPRCPSCRGLARPNILMFGDGGWRSGPTHAEEGRFDLWLARNKGRRLLAIELGAGTAIPSVRFVCRESAERLIRINPRDHAVPRGQVGLPLGALAALTAIDEALART